MELDGKVLGCWCTNASCNDGSSEVCHGQVLMRLLYEHKNLQAEKSKINIEVKPRPPVKIIVKINKINNK